MTRFLVLLLFLAPAVLAQGTLEVIPLRHRTVEQLLPVLRPLLEPGGALSGQSNQLSGRLGDWIELGGAGSSSARAESGILSSRQGTTAGERRTWVKVEELGN